MTIWYVVAAVMDKHCYAMTSCTCQLLARAPGALDVDRFLVDFVGPREDDAVFCIPGWAFQK